MKKRILISFLLAIGLLSGLAQAPIDNSNIKFEEIGKIKPRKAINIKSSYLGIGCEVLDRDFACYDCYKEYLGNLGVKHARFQSGWAKTEKEKGVYDFSWLDAVIDDCRSRGIQPWINTVYGNPIYEGGGDIQSSSKLPYSEEALDAWYKYIRNLVGHFKTRVFEWEIWNEIDHGSFKSSSAVQYAELYIKTASIIREIQPSGRITALALSSTGDTKFVREFLDYLREKGKIDLIDRVSFHGYPQNPDTGFERSDALIKLLKQYNENIVAFQGETGCPSSQGSSGALSNYPFTELSQAKWDLRRAMAHIGRGIQFSLFTLSEFNYPGNRLNTKGKLKIDNNMNVLYAKQSYYGYQNLTSLFDSTITANQFYNVKIDTDSSAVAYAFCDSNKSLTAVSYWKSGNIPSNRLSVTDASIIMETKGIKSPVLIDIRTGMVYKIPKDAIISSKANVVYKVPVYDSPVMICGKKFLKKRGLL